MRKIQIILALGLTMLLGSSLQGATTSPKVYVNGKAAESVVPIIKNGSTLVPLKAVGDLLEAQTTWDSRSKQVTIALGETSNMLTINEKVAQRKEGNKLTTTQLSMPPIIEQGVTYVPLRYIAENLGVKVNWEANTQCIELKEIVSYRNQKFYFGNTEEEITTLLGQPSFSLWDGQYNLLFYTGRPEETMIFYMTEGVLSGFCTNAKSFAFRGYSYAKESTSKDGEMMLIKDADNGDVSVAFAYGIRPTSKNSTSTAFLKANEAVIIALTNGFRAHHQVTPLVTNEKIAGIARTHAQDMAKNNFFEHTNLQGVSASQRLSSGGVNWQSCAENIAAGYSLGIETFGQWLNSSGHRKNMLSMQGEIGVGIAYDASSQYKYYYAQSFAKLR